MSVKLAIRSTVRGNEQSASETSDHYKEEDRFGTISRIPEKESYINRRSTRGLTGGETYSIKVLRTKEKTWVRVGKQGGPKSENR